jgi:ubiquitin C
MSDNNQHNDVPAKEEVQADGGGQFFVKTLTGKTICISLSDGLTVRQVKEEIQKLEQIPIDQQRLVFQGKQLEDNDTLKYYEVGPNATVHLVLRLRGGF